MRRVVLLGLAWVGLAQAQAPLELPEVRVQSGLIEQRQFDAPASVQRVDGERIRASGPQVNLSDVLTAVPGVVALNRNNYAQDVQISIRGFGARAAFGLRGIRLLVDGIPATTPDGQGQASTVSLTSVDRIEVLTGPLAQIYGNAAGGVIQAYTREASAQPEAQTQLYVGSYGLRRSDWQLSGRSGQVGMVADFSTLDTQGYRAQSAARRQQLNSVLTLDSSADTRHKWVVNLFEMPLAQDPLGLTSSNLGTPWAAGANAQSANTRKMVHQEQVGWVMQHRLERDLQLQTRLYRGDRSNLQYLSSQNWVGLERQYWGWGAQMQGQRDGHIPIQWTVGLEGDQSGEVRQGGAAPAGQKSGLPNRNEWNQANTLDGFAQINWLVSERFTWVTGLRRSSVVLRSNDQCLVSPPCSYADDGSGRVRYQSSNPVLGLTWHWHPQWNAYANTGRGFETPTLAEAAYVKSGNDLLGRFNPRLLAATSVHRELGLKFANEAGSRMSLAWFGIETQNEIVSDKVVNGQVAYTNATRTQRQGLEFNAQHRLGQHWRAEASVTAMRAVYSQTFSTVANGNRLPATPDRWGFAALHWSQMPATAQTRPSGWLASVEWLGRSGMWANDLNTATAAAPGYGGVNLRLRHRHVWASGQIEPYLAIENLHNKTTVGSVIVNQSNGGFFEPGLPRTWTLGLQAKWAL